jgi:hypothetical protein
VKMLDGGSALANLKNQNSRIGSRPFQGRDGVDWEVLRLCLPDEVRKSFGECLVHLRGDVPTSEKTGAGGCFVIFFRRPTGL